jgi:germination protein M
VLDDNGTVIDEGFTTAASMEVGQFGPFSAIADFDDPQTGIGRIEVFNLSARDGSVENLVTVLVRFL